jgi:hypothetical protein
VGDFIFQSISTWNGRLAFRALQLKEVSKSIEFSDITSELTMEFLSLEEVSSVKFSNVNIIGAPLQASVPGLWLTEGLIVEATNLDSLDATGGLTVYRDPKSEVSAINITVLNNPALKNLTVGVFGGNYNLLVAGNSPELVVDFNYFGNGWLNLSGCNNVTAYSVEQLDWATFDDNTFTSLDLPSLASVRNSFEIKSNLRLANLLLPKLEPARVIDVRDNADLHDLRVPSLLSVLESLNVSGALTRYSCTPIHLVSRESAGMSCALVYRFPHSPVQMATSSLSQPLTSTAPLLST